MSQLTRVIVDDHRRQAGSHNRSGTVVSDWANLRAPSLASQLLQWIGFGRERWVGCEGAFAGKPAPTGGACVGSRSLLRDFQGYCMSLNQFIFFNPLERL